MMADELGQIGTGVEDAEAAPAGHARQPGAETLGPLDAGGSGGRHRSARKRDLTTQPSDDNVLLGSRRLLRTSASARPSTGAWSSSAGSATSGWASSCASARRTWKLC